MVVAESWSYWEVFEAKKLNHYGWVERRGALLDVHYLAGVVPSPELHNYPNHPAPIHWANMLVLRVLGHWGVIVLWTSLGLAASITTLLALRQFYTPSVALIGSLLFILAPTSIIYDVDPNHGAIGAAAWPFLAFALTPALGPLYSAWLLGSTCLLAGQASWFVWIVFGALLVGVAGLNLNGRLRAAPARPLIIALLVGGGLTVLLFALQVVLYTPDWQDLTRYLSKQSVEKVGPLDWLLRITTRSAMSLGPALVIGALAGLIAILVRKKALPIALVSVAFLPLFGLASFVLRGFFQTENWPYEYLVFPTSIFCCAFLTAVPPGKVWRAAVLALTLLAIAGLPYVYLRVSNPSLSAETRFIADLMVGEAQPHEVVVTNLLDQAPPLQPWNVSGLYVAMFKADRLLRSNVNGIPQLGELLHKFHTDTLDIVYIRSMEQPVDDDLKTILKRYPSRTFTLPSHLGAVPLSLRLRGYYWQFTGRHKAAEAAATQAVANTLELSHLTVSRAADGGINVQPSTPRELTPSESKQNHP